MFVFTQSRIKNALEYLSARRKVEQRRSVENNIEILVAAQLMHRLCQKFKVCKAGVSFQNDPEYSHGNTHQTLSTFSQCSVFVFPKVWENFSCWHKIDKFPPGFRPFHKLLSWKEIQYVARVFHSSKHYQIWITFCGRCFLISASCSNRWLLHSWDPVWL